MERKSKDIIEALSHGPVQRYISDHENKDLRDLVLKHKVILGIPTAQLVEQIATRKKAKDKLPLYYNTQGIIFPPPANFEQCSSQTTALFKSEIIAGLTSVGKENGVDLTGGFGVDTFFLSKKFRHMHYVETETSLMELARYNHQLLYADNIEYHALSAEAFLGSTNASFDFVYADPSRRTADKKKVHSLRDARPDITTLTPEIFRKTSLLVVKASPLFDIQAGVSQLPSVKKVFVISVENECKELLFVCDKTFDGSFSIEAVDLENGAPVQSFEFSPNDERQQKVSYSDPLAFLYEPNASILKAGAFKSVAGRFQLKKLALNTHLYTGEEYHPDFPGRKFTVEALVKPDAAVLKRLFPDGKANVTTRNYPLTPEGLKKKTRLQDGGEKFLIGFSGEKKKFLAVAQRIR